MKQFSTQNKTETKEEVGETPNLVSQSNQEKIEEVESFKEVEETSLLSKLLDACPGDEEELEQFYDFASESELKRLDGVLNASDGDLVVSEASYVLEAVDARHRYGLGSWLRRWCFSGSELDFFGWIDEQNKYPTGMTGDAPGTEAEVKYLGDNERKAHQLDVSSGLTWTNNGKPVDGSVIFVLSTDGVFYGGNKDRDAENSLYGKKLHHTSFLSGLPVKTAGVLEVKSGTVTRITGHSGHYQPTPQHVWTGLNTLSKYGLSLDGVKVQPKPGEETEVDAMEFLDTFQKEETLE